MPDESKPHNTGVVGATQSGAIVPPIFELPSAPQSAPQSIPHAKALGHGVQWLLENAAHLGELAQAALAAGIRLSPQAQTAATIAILLGALAHKKEA